MAAQLIKKSSAKFKVGKKLKVNKWLIAAGVAVVVVVGVLVVRYSGASGVPSRIIANSCRSAKRSSSYFCNRLKDSIIAETTSSVSGSYQYCTHLVYHRGSKFTVTIAAGGRAVKQYYVPSTGQGNRDEWAEDRFCSPSISANREKPVGYFYLNDGSVYFYSLYLH